MAWQQWRSSRTEVWEPGWVLVVGRVFGVWGFRGLAFSGFGI